MTSSPASSPVHVPADWAGAAERILQGDLQRIMVIGPVDTGKSTFCLFLQEQAQRAGRAVALIDADVGQKTLGPPACITIAEETLERLFFVGTTNPIAGWARLVEGVKHSAGTTAADLLVVNTSGLLTGPGRSLKAAKIAAIAPDLLIGIGDHPDLDKIMSEHPEVPDLRVTQSPEARRKTDGVRRAARRQAFRRYFAGASMLELDRPDSGAFGRPAGLLVGLLDRQGGHVGMGILAQPAGTSAIGIVTPVARHLIHQVIPGSICLSEDFAEAPCTQARG